MNYPPISVWTLFLGLALLFGAGCSKKTDVASTLETADRHFAKREFEAAKIGYITVLRAQNTNSRAMLNLGKIFFEQGQIQQAYPLLARSKDLFPEDIPLREALAVIYSVGGTNLWEGEVAAILERDPANETAVMTLLRGANSPETLAQLTNTLASLRAKAGDRAIFHLAEAELARRRGDTNAGLASLQRAVAVEPTSPSAHLSLANYLLAGGSLDAALVSYNKAAELSPAHGTARYRLAQVLMQYGKLDESAKVLDEMNAKAPEVISAWTARAEVSFARKEYDEARRLLGRALSQSPNDPMALRLRAQIDLAENKPGDAVKVLETVAQAAPGSSEVQYQLGIANLLNKDMSGAIANLRAAAQLDPNAINTALLLAELEIARGGSNEAILLLTDLVRRAPNLAQAQMLLARAYRTTSRFDEAIAVYTSMQKQFPTNAAPSFQLGLVLRQRDRLPEARAAFETCLKIAPNDLAPAEQLVSLDMVAKDFDGALRRVQGMQDRNPMAPGPWVMRGTILIAQKDLTGAEAAFKKALEIDPESQPALLSLAQLYASSGKRTEALAELQRAVTKDPKNVGALTLTGMLNAEAGEHAAAKAAYEQALVAQPNAPLVLNNLAYLLSELMNDTAGGYVHASRARQLSPENVVVADTLGWIEFKRKNYPEALRLILEASEQLGANAEVQYHLGMAHYMMGQEGPARAALQLAVQGQGDFLGKTTAREYLAILNQGAGAGSPADIARLETRRREAPEDIIALSRLAAAYAKAGSHDKARDAYEAALKINPNSIDATTQLALLYADKLNNPTRAMELARAARKNAPDDPTVSLALGRIALVAGDHAYAYAVLEEASRRTTNQPQVSLDLAKAAYALGRVSEATNLLSRLSRSNVPSDVATPAQAFLELATVDAKAAGDFAGLLQLAEQTLAADPNHPAGLFARARIAERQERFPDAKTGYERLLEKFPSFAPASRNLAILLADRLGDDAKAFTLGTKAREAFPQDGPLAAMLGKVACRRGDHRYALQLLSDAARTQTNDAELQYYLGVAYLGLKQAPEGRTALEKAISLAPEAKFVPDAKKRLAAETGEGG